MKNFLLSFVLLAFVASSSFAQLAEKIKAENVVEGTIYKDGGEIVGYFKRTGDAMINDYSQQVYDSNGNLRYDSKKVDAPWEFQSSMRFIPKDVFEKNQKIKNKYYQKYTAKNCDGFKYDTLVYESVKYADMSAVGMNMIPKKMFMRKIEEGSVSLFYHYDKLPPVMNSNEVAHYYEECAKPRLVYRKGEKGKLKLVSALNIEKELSDCPYVIEKYKKGDYGKSDGETGFKKLVNNVLRGDGAKVRAINDYNSHMGS